MNTKIAGTGTPAGRPDLRHVARPEPGRSRRQRRSRTIAAAGMLVLIGAGVLLLLRDDGTDAVAEDPNPVTTGATLPILTPTDAALALYVAWQRGAPGEAARASTAPAAHRMLDVPTTAAAGLAFTGCIPAGTRTESCTWDRADARLTMTVTHPAHDRPQVTRVAFIRS